MSENIIYAMLFFPAAAAVLIFFMRYVSEIMQARARLGHDEAYREIATKVAAAQSEMAAVLSSLSVTLTEVQSRLSALEKILKQVE
jgi:Tfp pilus assembly protein PilO